MKKVSIITPTYNRTSFLRLTHKYILSQTYPNIEWLIYDDSETISREALGWKNSNSNIQYFYSPTRLSIGEKRNRLIEKASGEIIMHFDDDDYYAPSYVGKMLETMRKTDSDFVNLKGFFVYNVATKTFGFWDLKDLNGVHFGLSAEGIEPVTLGEEFKDNHLGYGFSYCYKKELWNEFKFPDINWAEDSGFIDQVVTKFKHGGELDTEGLALHYLHQTSTSRCFPQYLLPLTLSHKFFPNWVFECGE